MYWVYTRALRIELIHVSDQLMPTSQYQVMSKRRAHRKSGDGCVERKRRHIKVCVLNFYLRYKADRDSVTSRSLTVYIAHATTYRAYTARTMLPLALQYQERAFRPVQTHPGN